MQTCDTKKTKKTIQNTSAGNKVPAKIIQTRLKAHFKHLNPDIIIGTHIVIPLSKIN